MKILFMGTPDYAAAALKSLIDAGHEIVLVVTKPDKPVGRGGKIVFSPVKQLAMEHGMEIYQPSRVRDPESAEKLKQAGADIGVVAAFGQILSAENLSAPRLGCINIHASLLPRYRGASPIQQAILDGVEVTGVTIMQMDEGIDTGAILLQEEYRIRPDETAGSLFDKLTEIGASLIVEALRGIEAGTLRPVPQNEEFATLTRQIRKDMGEIRWHMDAAEIERQIRAMSPWPSAFTRLPDGRFLKIWRAEAWELAPSADPGSVAAYPTRRLLECGSSRDAAPGCVLYVDEGGSFFVACGKGVLCVREVQLEGKKRMAVHDFLLGFPMQTGYGFQ
ncbi:MAG: methionyl-tRNA formyltransferase [Lachnospiraceae bacterium]|nr:methionyl-tRNA formyltransferase [Lachnospiraceae bacterium]